MTPHKTVSFVRIFDCAPLDAWAAFTDARQLAQWWGPHGFSNPRCEFDPRPGGAIRIDMRGPDGVVYPCGGAVREVAAPVRLVFTTTAEDGGGRALLETLTTVRLLELGAQTVLLLETQLIDALPEAAQYVAGMEAGWRQSLERLATLLGAPPVAQGVIPHLVVGDAAAALTFYGHAFGANETMRVPADDGKRILHAEIFLNGGRVFVRDHFPEHCAGSEGGKSAPPSELGATPVTLHLEVVNCDAAVQRAVEAGAVVIMAPWDAFWGARYAMIADPFGHAWSLAHALTGKQTEGEQA
jgi:PhnB protein